MPKLLLVEDDEWNRDMLSRRLQRRGYTVVGAVDDVGAVALTHREKPDLILMDIELKGSERDGYQVTEELKADPVVSHIPIIALTGHVTTDHINKALAVGCDDHDSKPIEFPRLLQKIETLLDRSQT